MRNAVKCVRNVIVGATLVLAAGAADATPIVLNFDEVTSGSAANDTATGLGLRFQLASLLPLLDEFGDPIPGSEAYRPDPVPFDDVRVSDPNARAYGNAPSPSNALDAIDQGILITFDAPVDLLSFAVTLDQSTFGFPGIFDIVFQNDVGAALELLATAQSIPGFTASLAGPLTGIASIYLPSGAYYDNLSFEVVPEPGTAVLLGLGLAGLGATRRNVRRGGNA